jgi:hypothetical protein
LVNRKAILKLTDLSLIEQIEAEFPFFPRLHRIFTSITGHVLITRNDDSDPCLLATPPVSLHPCPSTQVDYSFEDGLKVETLCPSQSMTTFIDIQRYGYVVLEMRGCP